MKPIARELRKKQTEPELLLWQRIRKKQILNVTFNRQKTIYKYILDFYSHKAKLAIEIDGLQHTEIEQVEDDKVRDNILLCSYNIKTIRFSNDEVYDYLDDVVKQIYYETSVRIKPPGPSKLVPPPFGKWGLS